MATITRTAILTVWHFECPNAESQIRRWGITPMPICPL